MEIKYDLILIIIPIIIIVFLFIPSKEKDIKKHNRIANTLFIKSTPYYKKLFKKYKTYKIILFISLSTAIISSILLTSRIQKTDKQKINEYKRDIILCMDVSQSVDELNVEIIDNMKKTVKSLQGERFGISMFNTSSVLVSPLTDDYDFIIDRLNEIEKSIKINIKITNNNYVYEDEDFYYTRNYIYSGTLEGNEQRGSSLIGDGLASCVYSFPKLEEERTRIIIFSTDNDLAGKPIVTLDKAASLSKKNKIMVFGIGTKEMKEKDYLEMKQAVEKTGGAFYQQSNKTVNYIVNDIEKTSKSLINSKTTKKTTDLPAIPFIVLLLSCISTIICYKKVMV